MTTVELISPSDYCPQEKARKGRRETANVNKMRDHCWL